jgi:hypothetical protein
LDNISNNSLNGSDKYPKDVEAAYLYASKYRDEAKCLGDVRSQPKYPTSTSTRKYVNSTISTINPSIKPTTTNEYKKPTLKCSHCNRSGHTVNSCWQLKPKPTNTNYKPTSTSLCILDGVNVTSSIGVSKDEILIDNAASVSVFSNRDLLSNIVQLDKPQVAGTGGIIQLKFIGNHYLFGKVYFILIM